MESENPVRIQAIPTISERTLRDGIRAYSKLGLRAYDAVVMGLFGEYVWGCHADEFVRHYRRHVTSSHADIGVGTGYCLDHCGFDSPTPRIALIDLNENCLEHAARRLERYTPETYIRNACEPIQIDTRRFSSIGVGYSGLAASCHKPTRYSIIASWSMFFLRRNNMCLRTSDRGPRNLRFPLVDIRDVAGRVELGCPH